MTGPRVAGVISRVCESHTASLLQSLQCHRNLSTTGAGSFIRPLPSLCYGKTFLSALIDKYVEQLHDSNGLETVVLGSSNGAIRVEAVNMNKVRGRFSNLEQLREASLDNEGVSQADPPGEIRKTCSNIRGVDLSYCLVPSWDVVALIAIELPYLERLALNNNRLQPPSNSTLGRDAFLYLTELQLNSTLMSWQAIIDVISLMPRLQQLESGYNRLQSLSSSSPDHSEPVLVTLNLEGNQLSSWSEICQALMSFHNLRRLVLSSNSIKSIPAPSGPHLASTHISEWSSIDSLNVWCPQLESLTLNGTPLLEDPQCGRVWHQIAIARLPRLRLLDGTSVNQRQRIDAELFYLSRVARESFSSDVARAVTHPRWAELCEVHGTPDINSHRKSEQAKLKNHLIEIRTSFSAVSPPPSTNELSLTKAVKVLPSSPLRILRLKLLKLFNAPRGVESELWIRMANGEQAPLGDLGGADDDKEIDWWLESGSEVVLALKR
ncbi:hypothetical protein F5148DRAFT_1217935 [Russula earlei]|uniref:Uncharacterized protein n=1 Tax=Russula earlei TaxID=71964 RepID=A0ACC0U490_9AGAM|nr:hypothetical protein F5148DRAFT_1217935 [Russula earlei]